RILIGDVLLHLCAAIAPRARRRRKPAASTTMARCGNDRPRYFCGFHMWHEYSRCAAVQHSKYVGRFVGGNAYDRGDVGRARRQQDCVRRSAVEWSVLLIDHDEIEAYVTQDFCRLGAWRLDE